jgi:hypothetical protein
MVLGKKLASYLFTNFRSEEHKENENNKNSLLGHYWPYGCIHAHGLYP